MKRTLQIVIQWLSLLLVFAAPGVSLGGLPGKEAPAQHPVSTLKVTAESGSRSLRPTKDGHHAYETKKQNSLGTWQEKLRGHARSRRDNRVLEVISKERLLQENAEQDNSGTREAQEDSTKPISGEEADDVFDWDPQRRAVTVVISRHRVRLNLTLTSSANEATRSSGLEEQLQRLETFLIGNDVMPVALEQRNGEVLLTLVDGQVLSMKSPDLAEVDKGLLRR